MVGGFTTSDDFPTTSNALRAARTGTDAWFGVLTADLSGVSYASLYGGSDADSFRAAAVDPQGWVALAGLTGSSDFPLVNAFDTVLNSDVGANQAGTYLLLAPEND